MKKIIMILSLLFFGTLHAEELFNAPHFMDSEYYDPSADYIENLLLHYDAYYQKQTGKSPYLDSDENELVQLVGGCRRSSCPVYLRINLSQQNGYLYVGGSLERSFPISAARKPYATKTWDGNPNNRIYDKYTSTKYPGGDYAGLGNMPYAVFYYKGYAVHGTPKSNWDKLGQPASHGCVRMHPNHAKRFNRLVRKHGRRDSWIRVHW